LVPRYSALKEKDYDYLRFILKHGVVTAKQVLHFFEEPNLDRVYHRLRKLKAQKLVKNDKLAQTLGVYYCTHEVRNMLDMSVTVPTKVTIYTAEHDLLLNDLLIYQVKALEKAGIMPSYETERELRYQYLSKVQSNVEKLKLLNNVKDRIPDAVLRANGRIVAFELELTVKNHKRYKEKFSEFDQKFNDGTYDEIWYFVESKKVENALNKARQEVSIHKDKLKIKHLPSAIREG
jgi:hypothetical protein